MRTERGAVLIFVAVALVGLMAFASIVVDYGAMWVARGQAQNAADAGALAGAVSLAHTQGTQHAHDAAVAVTKDNHIFGRGAFDPEIVVTVPLVCPTPYNIPTPVQACVKVDVQRQDLPTFFARLLGMASQGVRATATAMAGAGNQTNCLKPWLIPDKWTELSTPPNQTFDPGTDIYIAPAPGNEATMTGWDLQDVGTILTLKEGDSHDVIAPSDFYEIGPANTYEEAITGCHITAKLGEQIETRPGKRSGPTKHGVEDLIALDKNATWNGSAIVGGDPQYQLSPRIVPIAMFSPPEYYAGDKQSGTFPLTLVNMMGFFVMSVDKDSTVTGVIINYPALNTGGFEAAGPASFLKTTILIR